MVALVFEQPPNARTSRPDEQPATLSIVIKSKTFFSRKCYGRNEMQILVPPLYIQTLSLFLDFPLVQFLSATLDTYIQVDEF